MAIGINLGDDEDAGPLSHWDEDYDLSPTVSKKQKVFKEFLSLSKKDKEWFETKLEEIRVRNSRKAFDELRKWGEVNLPKNKFGK